MRVRYETYFWENVQTLSLIHLRFYNWIKHEKQTDNDVYMTFHNGRIIITVSILSPCFENENETFTKSTYRPYSYPSENLFQSVNEMLSWMHYCYFASILEQQVLTMSLENVESTRSQESYSTTLGFDSWVPYL